MPDNRDGEASERLESHNASIDEQVARAHLCGRVHLPSGRTCVRPAAHPGSCSFEPAEQARRATQHSL